MKILWFTNSPCNSIIKDGTRVIKGGWLTALETEIVKCSDIQLSISFFSEKEENPFSFNGVCYYPIFLSKGCNAFQRIFNRIKSSQRIDDIMLPKMLSVVRQINPDIIHIHGTEERFGLIQKYIKDIPIVFSIQGLISSIDEKYFSAYSKNELLKFESWYDKVRFVSVRNQYEYFLYQKKREESYLSSAKYIFGRTFYDQAISLSFNVDRQYFVVNEIMREPFYKKKWIKTSFDDKLQLVSIISGGIYKGYEVVLKTAKLLKQSANIDFQWHIAGYKADDKFVKLAEVYTGISSSEVNIIFHGRMNADDLSDLLVQSDIYCHVSHIENSPNSVCEAMLVGMPIIATFAGGTASLLENEKEGILLQDGDSYILSGTILCLYYDFNKAKVYAENARQRALVRHTPKRVLNELFDGYKKILLDKNNL